MLCGWFTQEAPIFCYLFISLAWDVHVSMCLLKIRFGIAQSKMTIKHKCTTQQLEHNQAQKPVILYIFIHLLMGINLLMTS